MKRLSIAALLILLAFGVAAQTPVVPITIQNPTFAQGVVGWQFGLDSGITQSGGVNVAYVTHSSISQTLSVKPQAGTYVFQFSVANRFGPYPGHYEAEIDIGTQELCSTYGWGQYSFRKITLVCPVSNYFTLYNGLGFDSSQPLRLVFTENGQDFWGVLLKDTSLTAEP